jgi:hypothetical protein
MAYNYGLYAGTTHKVTSSGSSAASSTAFDDATIFVRVVASAAGHIVFASSPTATNSDIYLPAGQIEVFKVAPGDKVAFIGSGDLYATEMS